VIGTRIDAGREVSEALSLLASRWMLAVPTAVASLLCAAIVFFAIGAVLVSIVAGAVIGRAAGAFAALGAGAAGLLVALAAIAVLAYVAHVLVVAAAHDAWEGREPDFGAALRLTMRRLPALLVAFVLIGLMMIVPLLLSLVLIGIPLLLVLSYFLMYVTPAIVFDDQDAVSAIATSFRLASRHANPTLIAYCAILAAFFVGRFVDAFCVHVPGLGLLTAFVVGGFTAAYGALVKARFYVLLRGAN
jgi:hypothetical protein